MKEGTTNTAIIGIAILLAALLHAGITRSVGRYQAFTDPRGLLFQVDTVSGEVRNSNEAFFTKRN